MQSALLAGGRSAKAQRPIAAVVPSCSSSGDHLMVQLQSFQRLFLVVAGAARVDGVVGLWFPARPAGFVAILVLLIGI